MQMEITNMGYGLPPAAREGTGGPGSATAPDVRAEAGENAFAGNGDTLRQLTGLPAAPRGGFRTGLGVRSSTGRPSARQPPRTALLRAVVTMRSRARPAG
ncbi:hypothetical protein GCM10010372_80460 [Streptomyces tauricus]|nr:hypothetical protein GCM10010372_80460 [Streptomyces tauricus]